MQCSVTFDDDCVCGQIDPPGQRSCAAEHLDDPALEHLLGHCSVGPQHACVMDADTLHNPTHPTQVCALASSNNVQIVTVLYHVMLFCVMLCYVVLCSIVQ